MSLLRLLLPALPCIAPLTGPARAQAEPVTTEAGQPLFVIVYRAGPAGRLGALVAGQPGMRVP